jgi:ATP-dependent Clp protease ATP-binding subunit ClpX
MRAYRTGQRSTASCSFCGRAEDEVWRLISGPMALICDRCIESSMDLLDREKRSQFRRLDGSVFAPRVIKSELDASVVGQEHAKRVLSVAVYNHYKRLAHASHPDGIELPKSNILLLGPTGSGKTLLAQTLARIVDVPFAMADATTLTETGYIGQDVDSILLRLLEAAGKDVERAECGIVFIDEIDKIGRRSDGASPDGGSDRDIGGEGVQQALLRMLQGARLSVPLTGERHRSMPASLEVDTTDILFICAGAFSGLEAIIAARKRSRMAGFGAPIGALGPRTTATILREAGDDDLLAFGLIPELVGRLPVIATLDALGEEALIEILTAPRNALVRQYQHLFAMDDVELEFTADALKAVAAAALRQGTGARGLRSILERVLLDAMYDLPDREDVRKIVIHGEAIGGAAPSFHVHVDERKSTGTQG